MAKYKTYSEENNIQDKKQADILDYFERQDPKFTCKRLSKTDFNITLFDKIYGTIEIGAVAFSRAENNTLMLDSEIKTFHANLVGLFASLRNHV